MRRLISSGIGAYPIPRDAASLDEAFRAIARISPSDAPVASAFANAFLVDSRSAETYASSPSSALFVSGPGCKK